MAAGLPSFVLPPTHLTRAQARAVDAYAVETLGLPGLVLMENAAANLAALVEQEVVGELGLDLARARVQVVCGRGNNGGDGYALARQLLARGLGPRVWSVGSTQRLSGDAEANRGALKAMGVSIYSDPEPGDLAEAHVVVDAVLGSGFEVAGGPPRGPVAAAIAAMNAAGAGGARVVAADLPSGMDADLGRPAAGAECVRAAVTVTFVAPKAGFAAADPGRLGRVVVVGIGLPGAAVAAALEASA